MVACRLSWVLETTAAALLWWCCCCSAASLLLSANQSTTCTSLRSWQGGWTTLWRGTQPTVIRLGLGAGLHFLILVRVC